MTAHLVPCTIREAKKFVAAHYCHLPPPAGAVFAVGLADDEEDPDRAFDHPAGRILIGVALVGRPSARMLDDGQTLEVTRCCVADGAHNGCSHLYGACWRAAKALGYTRLVTYTRADEPGTSLKAAGWRVVARRPAYTGWWRAARPRTDHGSAGIEHTLWEAT